VLRRHRRLIIDLRSRDNHPTLLAIARLNHFAVFPALEGSLKTIQAQIRFWPVLPMTPRA
jgi:hypothetical protein